MSFSSGLGLSHSVVNILTGIVQHPLTFKSPTVDMGQSLAEGRFRYIEKHTT